MTFPQEKLVEKVQLASFKPLATQNLLAIEQYKTDFSVLTGLRKAWASVNCGDMPRGTTADTCCTASSSDTNYNKREQNEDLLLPTYSFIVMWVHFSLLKTISIVLLFRVVHSLFLTCIRNSYIVPITFV